MLEYNNIDSNSFLLLMIAVLMLLMMIECRIFESVSITELKYKLDCNTCAFWKKMRTNFFIFFFESMLKHIRIVHLIEQAVNELVRATTAIQYKIGYKFRSSESKQKHSTLKTNRGVNLNICFALFILSGIMCFDWSVVSI